MRQNGLTLSAFFWLLLLSPAWADYQDGAAAMQRHDYARALVAWTDAAKHGDPRAYTGLGVLYQSGLGVARDDAAAFA